MNNFIANILIRRWHKKNLETSLREYLKLSLDEMHDFMLSSKLPGDFLKRHFDL